MKSIILSSATRYLLPLLLLFSIFLLLRGHNDSGGGFAGGLVAAAAFSLYAIAHGVDAAKDALQVHPRSLIAWGLLVALGSALIPALAGRPLMSGLWSERTLPVIGKVGTPFLFDIGVYLAVIGVTLLIIFSLAEEE
ncbi:MAG: Na+/H+ antiporter subunit B [Chloroflexota bacterium]